MKHPFPLRSAPALGVLACLFGLVLSLSACDDDSNVVWPDEDWTLLQAVVNTPSLATLESALDAAGLSETLSGTGPFTVFAVQNDAFEAVNVDTLMDQPDRLENILRYHIVEGALTTGDLADDQELTTLSGDALTVDIVDGTVFINGARLIAQNVRVRNGVYHIVDRPLFPTLADQIELTNRTTTLAEVLVAAEIDFDDTAGPVTIFAPVNAAFENLGEDRVAALLDDAELLDRVLGFHVVPGEVRAADLTDGMTLTTVGGEEIDVRVEDGDVFVDGAPVIDADNETAQGVVHFVDRVLFGATTVPERIRFTPSFSVLEDALDAADLMLTLAATEDITVFAPVNTGFDDLDDDQLMEDQDLLQEILQYHVVPMRIAASEITDGMTVETLEGEQLTFTVTDEGGVWVNGVPVTEPDIRATSGVIHAIDGVLLASVNVATRIRLMAATDELEEALAQAGLVGTLSSGGPYTVFAPSDDAVGLDTLQALEGQQTQLSKILRYHVVQDELMASEITDGQTVTTLEGSQLSFIVDEDGVRVVADNDTVSVDQADLGADNGVIHLIDQVMLPPADNGGIVISTGN